MNDTIAVVVTYNRLKLLKECINSLLKQDKECDVLIVNNASTDGTEEWCKTLAKFEKKITYHNTGSNLGGAGGFYFGMKIAYEKGYDYIWIMDDDCIPTTSALAKFLEAESILNGKYGWLSSLCYWKDRTLCSMNVQMKSPYKKIKVSNETLIPSKMASFVSLFLRRQTIIDYGLPIKEFVIWTDDWEYTRRISRLLECYTVTNSIVYHKMASNSVVNIASDIEERLWRYKYFYRNDVVLYSREGIKGWVWLIAKDVWHSLQVIGSLKFDRLPIIWRGFFYGLEFRKTIIYHYCNNGKKIGGIGI